MNIIERFRDKVLEDNTDSFEFIDTKLKYGKQYYFIQSRVGKAKYVYGEYTYNDHNPHARINKKPDLLAIVADGTVYIVDRYFFGLDIEYPENVVLFSDYISKRKECVPQLFKEFYEKLDTLNFDECDFNKNTIMYEARKLLFYGEELELSIPEGVIGAQDVANDLCGIKSAESAALEYFEEHIDAYKRGKTRNEEIKRLMNSPETMQKWELEMAEALRDLEANRVTVVFKMNGKTEMDKIKLSELKRLLINRDYFSSYYFSTADKGKKILANLGATSWRDDNCLRCEHIMRITYGRKCLYEVQM